MQSIPITYLDLPSLSGHGGDAGHNCGTTGEGGEGEGGSGRELAHASRMLGLDPVAVGGDRENSRTVALPPSLSVVNLNISTLLLTKVTRPRSSRAAGLVSCCTRCGCSQRIPRDLATGGQRGITRRRGQRWIGHRGTCTVLLVQYSIGTRSTSTVLVGTEVRSHFTAQRNTVPPTTDTQARN